MRENLPLNLKTLARAAGGAARCQTHEPVRLDALKCERPAEADRSRKTGKTTEHRSPELALPTIAPPEGIEPSLPRLRIPEPASTGGGYHRMCGGSDARCEKRTRGAHRVNSRRRNTHNFAPCPIAARTDRFVTEAGAFALSSSKKGSE